MEGIGRERARKGDDSFRALPPLTPPPARGPGPVSPSSPPPPPGSGLPHSPPPSAAVLALPASPAPAASAMDGAAETMLVRRSKAKKKRPQARDSGSGDRFRALCRDYHELLEDTEAKKNRLASANRRKLALLAEVKFLRRKYRSFAKGGSQKTQCKLKKQARHIQSPLGSNKATAFAHHGAGTDGVPSTSNNPNFDLNQDSVMMNDEGIDCQGHRAHPEVENFDQVEVDEDMMTTNVKLSVCRDTGNSPASDGKRTVPWQDRLALKA